MAGEEAKRASPDALLALARKEGRGRLKIFLGAAPGVGKTYAMLTAARAEKASGRDVAAGLGRIDIHRIHIVAAASLMNPVKCSVRLSYRVAKRRKCLSRQKQRSMRLRCL